MALKMWAVSLLSEGVEETQKIHITGVDNAKQLWDKLKELHGAAGKGRLCPMLQKFFFRYVKASDEPIDSMVASLNELSDETYDTKPTARPSDITRAVIMFNACEGEEYAVTKHLLLKDDGLTPERVAEELQTMEQVQAFKEEAANVANSKGNGGGRLGQPEAVGRATLSVTIVGRKAASNMSVPTSPRKTRVRGSQTTGSRGNRARLQAT